MRAPVRCGLGRKCYRRVYDQAAEINAVTLEQVRDVAQKYFRDPLRATALVTPETGATR